MEQFLIDTARAQLSERRGTTRRRGRYVVAGLAGAAAVAVAAVGIDYTVSGTGAPSPTGNPTAPGVHNHLAAFSVFTNPGGTVTLTLSQRQVFDPNAVRRALIRAGVPAVVTVGSVCTVPDRPSNGLPQVISRALEPDGTTVTTITPSAIPAGEKLSFGFLPVSNGGGRLFISLVPDNASLTCTSTPPAPPRHGAGIPTR